MRYTKAGINRQLAAWVQRVEIQPSTMRSIAGVSRYGSCIVVSNLVDWIKRYLNKPHHKQRRSDASAWLRCICLADESMKDLLRQHIEGARSGIALYLSKGNDIRKPPLLRSVVVAVDYAREISKALKLWSDKIQRLDEMIAELEVNQ